MGGRGDTARFSFAVGRDPRSFVQHRQSETVFAKAPVPLQTTSVFHNAPLHLKKVRLMFASPRILADRWCLVKPNGSDSEPNREVAFGPTQTANPSLETYPQY